MRRLLLRTDRVYLAAAAFVPMALDFLLTLLGQHPSYWYTAERWVDEQNPVWRSLLLIHPAAFVAGVLLYAIVFTAGIYFSPKPVAWWLSIVLLLTHMSGARSWLPHFTDQFTPWEMVLNGSTALLAVCCFLMASRRKNESDSVAGRVREGHPDKGDVQPLTSGREVSTTHDEADGRIGA